MNQPTFEDRLHWLAHGDVAPVLLVTDLHYTDALTVEVAFVDPSTVTRNGYSSVGVFSRRFPYPEGRMDPDLAERHRAETLVAFGERLRTLLATGADTEL